MPCVAKNVVNTHGTNNCRQLFLTSPQVILVRLIKPEDNPVNALLLRYNCLNVVKVARESGRVDKVLVDRFNVVNAVRLSISEGTIQTRWLFVKLMPLTLFASQVTPYRPQILEKFHRLVFVVRLSPLVALKSDTSARHSLAGTLVMLSHIPVVRTVVIHPPQELVCGL